METGITNSIKVKSRYAQLLSTFDMDLQTAVDDALQRYLVEQIRIKIKALKKKDQAFQKKYGKDYNLFCRLVAEDENYVEQIEKDITKLWESDLSEWEFCHEGIKDWTEQLQNILIMPPTPGLFE
jgi:hypothetical protein